MDHAGWPDVALAVLAFAREDPKLFLVTVPITGIVVLAGAFLFLRIIVIKPTSGHWADYQQRRRQHRPPELAGGAYSLIDKPRQISGIPQISVMQNCS
jgi:hypothetical protein